MHDIERTVLSRQPGACKFGGQLTVLQISGRYEYLHVALLKLIASGLRTRQLAERVGFEPTVHDGQHPEGPASIQPLSHLSAPFVTAAFTRIERRPTVRHPTVRTADSGGELLDGGTKERGP